MEHPKDKTDVERYMAASAKLFDRLPEQKRPNRDVVTRAATLGTLFGFTDYVVGPAIFHMDRSGNQDEISVLLAAAAGFSFGSIQSIKALCQTDSGQRPKKLTERLKKFLNIGAGAVGGTTLAGAVLPLVGIATLSAAAPYLLVGVFGGAAIGGVHYAINKRKVCQYCHDKGDCTQKVCRKCGMLFWPKEVKLDCEHPNFLDWSTVASFLQTAYKLTYLQAEALAREFFDKWIIKTPKNNLEVSCAKFEKWVRENELLIADFKNEHVVEMTKQVADDLDSREL